MTEEMEPNYVAIQDEDGNVTRCEIYDIVDFEDKTYAMLIPMDEEDEEEPEMIVLEYVEEGEEGYFQNIDDEEEFERVCEYIQTLEYEDEEDEE